MSLCDVLREVIDVVASCSEVKSLHGSGPSLLIDGCVNTDSQIAVYRAWEKRQ